MEQDESDDFITPTTKSQSTPAPSIKKKKSPRTSPSTNNNLAPKITSFFQPKAIVDNIVASTPKKVERTRLNLNRDNDAEVIPFPRTFDQLISVTAQKYNIPKENVELRTMRANIVTESDFLNLVDDENLLVLDKNENGQLNVVHEFVVDITPTKNMLFKAGTSEYDPASAIAELIDNSVQAVRDNPDGRRMIQVRLKESESNKDQAKVIYIWDNGCGMDPDQLRAWGTMGASQSDTTDKLTRDGESISDRGYISRYGVGAKRAAFFLGKTVTVSSKVKESPWVYVLTMSLDKLNQYGESEWKTTMQTRNTGPKESKQASFTLVKISDLNFEWDAHTKFDAGVYALQRDLAHMYYYYIHSRSKVDNGEDKEEEEQPEENSQKKSKSKSKKSKTANKSKSKKKKVEVSEETSDEEFNQSMDSTSPAEVGTYEIKVQGVRLSKVTDDMESKYQNLGKNPVDFKFKVKISEKENRESNVKLHLAYYPFEDAETLPPANPSKPETSRKPGVEVYWNDRLIKNAHFDLADSFAFCATGTHSGTKTKLQDKWYNRVKGQLFINSDFPVTHNKMSICPEDYAWKQLSKYDDRHMKKQFKQWLIECHTKLDQEVLYIDPKYDPHETRTVFEGLSLGNIKLKLGNYVAVKGKSNKKRIGKLLEIWHSGSVEDKKSVGMIKIKPYTHVELPEETYPVSSIKEAISDDKFKEYTTLQKKQLPNKIKFYEGDNVPYPKDKLNAGEHYHYISVAIENGLKEYINPNIAKEFDLKIKFSVTFNGNDTEEEVFMLESNQFYKNGRISFRDIKCFDKAGPYKLHVELLGFDSVKPISFPVTVEPGNAQGLILSIGSVEEPILFVGQMLPTFIASQVDERGNIVPLKDDEVMSEMQFECRYKNSTEFVELTQEPDVTIKEGSWVITNLIIENAICEPDGTDIYFTFGIDNKFATVDAKIFAGLPTQLTVDPDIFSIDKIYEPKSQVEKFKVELRDKLGNLATAQDCTVQIDGNSMKKSVKSKVVNSIAEFKNGFKLNHKGGDQATVTISVIQGKKNATTVLYEVDKVLHLSPSKDASMIELITSEEDTIEQEEPLKLIGTVGETRKWKVRIMNEGKQPLTGLNGTLVCSWADEIEIEDSQEEIELPEITFEEKVKSLTLIVTWIPKGLKKNKGIPYKFSVNLKPSKPSSFELISDSTNISVGKENIFHLYFVDCYGNRVTQIEKSLIDACQPELHFDDKIKNVSDDIFKWCPEGYYIRCVIINTNELGACNITVNDKSETIKSSVSEFSIVNGEPTQLRINKLPRLTLSIKRGEGLQDCIVSLCDNSGNVTKINDISITIVAEPGSKLPFKPPKKMVLTEGVCLLTQIQSIDCDSGEYKLMIKSNTVMVEPCYLILRVDADPEEPTRIDISQLFDGIIVGTSLPTVKVQLFSIDSLVIKDISQLSLYFDSKKYPCNSLDSDGYYYFQNIPAPQRSGPHQLRIRYTSSRTLDEEITIEIEPSDPVKILIPDRAIPHQYVKSGQTLFDSLEIIIVDQYNNQINKDIPNLKIDLSVTKDINNLSASQGNDGNIPELLGKLSEKVIRGVATFSTVKLSETKAKTNIYKLKFSAPDKFHLRSSEIEFFYQNEDEQLAYRDQLQQKSVSLKNNINEIQKKITNLNIELTEKSKKLDDASALIEESTIKLKESLKEDTNGVVEKITENQETALMTAQMIIKAMNDRLNTYLIEQKTNARDPRYITNPALDEMLNLFKSKGPETGIIGVIAELAFIENPNEAELLAKLTGAKMSAIVLENQKTFDFYYNKYKTSNYPLNMISMEGILPFRPKQQQQSQVENDNPLSLYPMSGAPVDGFEGFAVNRIKLKKKHEFLRKSLFWNIYRDVMVFKKISDGMNYRNHCVKHGKPCPTIITIDDGETIESTGFVLVGDKTKNRSKNPTTFGTLPATESEDYNNEKQVLTDLKQMAEHIEEFNKIKSKVQPELNEIEQQIENLKSQLREYKKEQKTVSEELNSVGEDIDINLNPNKKQKNGNSSELSKSDNSNNNNGNGNTSKKSKRKAFHKDNEEEEEETVDKLKKKNKKGNSKQ